jgi:hypothetical protein
VLPAIVMDASKLLGIREAVTVGADGYQIALIRVASTDGGFLVLASTASQHGPKLQPGKLVVWRAEKHSSKIAQNSSDKRFGWVGLILGTLKTEYRDGMWIGGERFLSPI